MAATFTVADKRNLNWLVSNVAWLNAQLISLQIIAASTANLVKTYATLALMKAEAQPTQVRLYRLLGLAAEGDGLAGGEYYYSPTNVEVANDITIIQLTSTSTGRLLKLN